MSAAIDRLGEAGARLTDEKMPLVDDMMQVNAKGGFSPAEAYAIHRERLARTRRGVDPDVRARIERGANITAADYIDMVQAAPRLVQAMDARLAAFDALVLPTTPIVAPSIAEVATPKEFGRKNAMPLRNTDLDQFLRPLRHLAAIAAASGLSTGLMLVGRNGHDRRLFSIAAAVEKRWARPPAALRATAGNALRLVSATGRPRVARPAPWPPRSLTKAVGPPLSRLPGAAALYHDAKVQSSGEEPCLSRATSR